MAGKFESKQKYRFVGTKPTGETFTTSWHETTSEVIEEVIGMGLAEQLKGAKLK